MTVDRATASDNFDRALDLFGNHHPWHKATAVATDDLPDRDRATIQEPSTHSLATILPGICF